MGRLASRYADLDIQARFPYAMYSALLQAPSVVGVPFFSEDFLNAQDKTIEVHRMIPRVYALDVNSLPLGTQPDQELLAGLCLIAFNLQGFNQQVNKNATLLGTLTKGSAERTWEFADPLYLPNGRGLQVFLTTAAFPATFAGLGITQLRVAITFEGFLISVAPTRG